VRTVQSFWFGSVLPEMQQLGIKSFLRLGYQYDLYAYSPVEGVPAGATLCDAAAILPRDRLFCYQSGFGRGSYAAFSNLFRYRLIFERGGWWVDTDVVALKEFDSGESTILATEYETDWSIQCSTAAFKAPAGSLFLKYCEDAIGERDLAMLQWGEIGPMLFDAAVTRFGLTNFRKPPVVFSPISYFEFRDIIRPGFDMSRLEGACAVHLWNQMWRHEHIDPADAPAGSLYISLRMQICPTSSSCAGS
jgi:hypothetical protein